jgi:hypothetical protein
MLQKTGSAAPSTHHPEEEHVSAAIPSSEELGTLKVAQLKELCEEHGLETKGKKADLLKRLRENLHVRMWVVC